MDKEELLEAGYHTGQRRLMSTSNTDICHSTPGTAFAVAQNSSTWKRKPWIILDEVDVATVVR